MTLAQPSFSVAVASEPRVLANRLDGRDPNRMAPTVIEWVRLNHEAGAILVGRRLLDA
jgi:hypothetical protein